MKTALKQIIPLVALAGVLALFTGCSCYGEKKASNLNEATILALADCKPSFRSKDRPAYVKAPPGAILILAADIPGAKKKTLTYQWFKGGEAITNANSPTLKVGPVTTNDVDFYKCVISEFKERSNGMTLKGGPCETQPAMLMMSPTNGGGGPSYIIVPGTPVVSPGPGGSGCPGPYNGYVTYLGSGPYFSGFVPIYVADPLYRSYVARDIQRTTSKVEYVGAYGDWGCNGYTITVPHSTTASPFLPPDPEYRFTIYFPVGTSVPKGTYKIQLTNFN